MSEHVRGIFTKASRSRYIIINSEISAFWQRFICAHELGHDRLKHSINGFHVDRSDVIRNDKFEREANLFASLLLCGDRGPHIMNVSWFRDLLHEATKYKDSQRLAQIICEITEEYI